MSQQSTSRLAISAEPDVVRRALAYAVVVGAVLVTINHGDAVLRLLTEGERLSPARLWRMGLTVVVPYIVSTFSSVGAIRDMRVKAAAGRA